MTQPLDERLRETLAGPGDEAPVGKAVQILLDCADRSGVSDIHLNPTGEGLDVFFRIDGVLQRQARIDPAWSERLIGKIKVLSGLLTYRRDIPQDGQIPADQAGGRTDVRVSILPTIHGEKGVLRFFLHGTEKFSLDQLGFTPETVRRLRAAVARPDGVILLTGPSGSGKTSTIYSLLREIVRPSGSLLRHVVTIEDPVEHALPGITQTQINPSANLTFASSLRSILRQDPQVIMVGEIRDRETAHVAMEAGLTGHLVISTIHSGTAAGVIVRLFEMGIETHILTTALSCVLAQRLARKLCPHGRGGCADCHGTGFLGRQVIAELIEIDDPLRAVIAGCPSRGAIEKAAVAQGMVPLRRDGERLVREGATTEDELQRVMG